MNLHIGHVDPRLVVPEATRLATLGGAAVPARANDLPDLAESGPPQVTAVTRSLAVTSGGQVVASGGTTGKIKITTIAPDQGIPRLLRSWHPLHPGDVLLNLFRPGRLWGAHYFYNALAGYCSASLLPMGPVAADELPDWVDVFRDTGVTALAGAPSVLVDFAVAARAIGADLPVRTVVWAGEPMTPARGAAITTAFPDARFWGNYGSIETYVIGVNQPGCDTETLHLLPDQVLEVDDERSLLTRTRGGWPVPLARYRLGDRITGAECRCGEPDAFRVLGRTDDRIKFHNTMLRLGDLLEVARGVPGVDDAQVILTADPTNPTAVTAIEIRFTGAERDPAPVRAALLRRVYALAAITGHVADSVRVRWATELDRNDRTGKVTPHLLRRPAEAGRGKD